MHVKRYALFAITKLFHHANPGSGEATMEPEAEPLELPSPEFVKETVAIMGNLERLNPAQAKACLHLVQTVRIKTTPVDLDLLMIEVSLEDQLARNGITVQAPPKPGVDR
jgi:hypothetical protein